MTECLQHLKLCKIKVPLQHQSHIVCVVVQYEDHLYETDVSLQMFVRLTSAGNL